MELNGIKALYVEDNRMTARVLESRLTKRGAQVRLADSGEAGLKAIEAEHFDLLVVDYQLPGMDGLEVIQNLASRGKLPSTIMLTATGDEGIAVEAIKWGASDYLVKEGNYLDLLPAVIRQVLEQTEVLREKQLAEERLRFSESTKSALLDAMPDAIITLDPLLRIIEYRVPENHLFPRENLVGVPVREVLPMQAGIEKLDGIWALRNSQLPVTVEFWHEGPNGERRYYENRISRFWDAYLLLVIRDVTARVKAEQEKENLIGKLKEALSEIKTLSGLIPICSSCKKIRDDQGYWNSLEVYMHEHTDASFSHSYCPECIKREFPEVYVEGKFK